MRAQPAPAVPHEPGLPAPSPEGSPVLCGLLPREAQTPLAMSVRQAEAEEQEREGGSRGAVPHEMEVLGPAPGTQPQPSLRGVLSCFISPRAGAPGGLGRQLPAGAAEQPLARLGPGAPLRSLASSWITLLSTQFPIWHFGYRGNSMLPLSDPISSQLVNTALAPALVWQHRTALHPG